MNDSRHVGIVLFDGVEELDAVGPWEVLAHWATEYPDDGWTVSCISPHGPLVTAAKGLVIGADSSLDDTPALGVLLHPGGHGTRPLLRDPAHLDWIRAQRATVPLLTSVCTGSLVYAAAGLLRDRPATTHWSALGELRDLEPTVRERPDDRFVDDGDMITSAGVSAGIDMALHLVARLAGVDRAKQVRRGSSTTPSRPPSSRLSGGPAQDAPANVAVVRARDVEAGSLSRHRLDVRQPGTDGGDPPVSTARMAALLGSGIRAPHPGRNHGAP